MTITKGDLQDTQWDTSAWSYEQKIKWQEYMFDLGFCWFSSGKKVKHLDKKYYAFGGDRFILADNMDFYKHKECFYEDVFPNDEDALPDEPCLFKDLIDHTNKYGVVLTVTHDAVEISYDDLGGLDIVVYNQKELDQVLAAIKLLQDKIN